MMTRSTFIGLMQRFNQLGRQLPSEDDILEDNASAISTAKLLLREMEQTKVQIDEMLGLEHIPLSRTSDTEAN